MLASLRSVTRGSWEGTSVNFSVRMLNKMQAFNILAVALHSVSAVMSAVELGCMLTRSVLSTWSTCSLTRAGLSEIVYLPNLKNHPLVSIAFLRKVHNIASIRHVHFKTRTSKNLFEVFTIPILGGFRELGSGARETISGCKFSSRDVHTVIFKSRRTYCRPHTRMLQTVLL